MKHGITHPATWILTYKGETRRFTGHLAAEMYFKTGIEPEVKAVLIEGSDDVLANMD